MSANAAIFNPTESTSAATGDGFSVPRLTTTGRLAITFGTGDKGMMVYDTTLNNLFIWNGSAWESVPASGDAGANGDVQYNDNGIIAGATGFSYAKATGAVSITGDLTVATDRLKVNTGSTAVQIGATTQTQIGTTAWPSDLISKANSRVLVGNLGTLLCWNESTPAIGNASTLYIGAKSGAGATTFGGGSLNAGTENASNRAGFLAFSTIQSNGIERERYRIDSNGAHTWTYVGGTAGTQMTLDSSGNLGLAVTPSAWSGGVIGFQSAYGVLAGNSQVNVARNAYYGSGGWTYVANATASLYSQISGDHRWNIAGASTGAISWTQAMTLDASGNLVVGKSSISATTVGFESRANGTVNSTLASSVDANATYAAYSTGAAAYRFYVGMGGTVYATNTTISAISDARLKENVQDIDVGLGAILALKPRKFDWKEGKGKNIKGDRGFIAQEFETVFPNLIDEWKDAAPAGEAPYKSVRQDLIPVLVKAIQELAAEVNALKKS